LAAVLAWRRPRRAKAVLLLLVPARYRVFPALCVIWSVLVTWEELLYARRPRLPIDWRLAGIVVILLLVSWASYWRPTAYRRSGPTWTTALDSAALQCRNQRLKTVSVTISPVATES